MLGAAPFRRGRTRARACEPRSGDRPERVVKGGVLPTPRPVSRVLVRSSPPSVGLPAPGGSPARLRPRACPRAPNCASNCPRSRLPLKRRRRGHLPTAGVAEVQGTALGRIPLRPAARRWGAVDRGSRPARSAPAPGPGRREARLGARRGAGAQEAHPGLLGKVPKPGGRRLLPGRRLLGTRPAGEEAAGRWRRRREGGFENPASAAALGEAGVVLTLFKLSQ